MLLEYRSLKYLCIESLLKGKYFMDWPKARDLPFKRGLPAPFLFQDGVTQLIKDLNDLKTSIFFK